MYSDTAPAAGRCKYACRDRPQVMSSSQACGNCVTAEACLDVMPGDTLAVQDGSVCRKVVSPSVSLQKLEGTVAGQLLPQPWEGRGAI